MNILFRFRLILVVMLGFGAAPAFAQLTLLEEGGTFFSGNLAPAGTAFAKDVLPAPPAHTIPHLNDGVYGNANSWINNSADSFAGINLGATTVPVNRIAFGRDNLGTFGDRCVDVYTIQYTTDPNPDATTTAWTDIGTVDYGAGGLAPANPAKRHAFSFPTVNATGIRIVTPTSGTCIDEIELDYVVVIPGAPTNITLSATSLKENNAAGANIGTLTATDPDAGDTHTFTFAGGADDAAFTISGDVLSINGVADFETKSSYSVRIRATDSSAGALTFEKTFTITVTNVGENAPVVTTSTSVGFIPEGNAAGFFVLSWQAGGTDAGTDFVYSLSGGPDDSAFTVTGNSVFLNEVANFATKSSYSFRFRVTNADNASLYHEETLTYYVKGKTLSVQLDSQTIAEDQTGVNIGVQFTGDTTTFVLSNSGVASIYVEVLSVPSAYTVTAVGGTGGGTGSTGSGTPTGSGSGSGMPTGSGTTLATCYVDANATAFVTLTCSDPSLERSGLVRLGLTGTQESRSAFNFAIVAGNPRGGTVVNDTFTATSGVALVAPLANDESTNVTITRVLGGNATIAPDGRHLIIAGGYIGTLTYVTSNDAIGTVTIVAGTPVATPTKWLGLLRDTNGKISGQVAVAASRGKYTAALNLGHVKKSAKFTPGTLVTTKLGDFNATLDGANHLQVTLGTHTGDLSPLQATATATKFNAALAAIDPALLGGGYANLSVKKNGAVTAMGTLPDGTKFSTASALTDSNNAPIYAPAKATKPVATVAGSLAFSSLTATDLTGELTWVKPTQTKPTGLHTSGVNTVVTVTGCEVIPVTPPSGDLDTTLSGANFPTPVLVSPVMTLGKTARLDPLKSFVLNAKKNTISGSVIFPMTTKVVPFSGVYLQKSARYWGFLKGDTTGGRVDAVID